MEETGSSSQFQTPAAQSHWVPLTPSLLNSWRSARRSYLVWPIVRGTLLCSDLDTAAGGGSVSCISRSSTVSPLLDVNIGNTWHLVEAVWYVLQRTFLYVVEQLFLWDVQTLGALLDCLHVHARLVESVHGCSWSIKREYQMSLNCNKLAINVCMFILYAVWDCLARPPLKILSPKNAAHFQIALILKLQR